MAKQRAEDEEKVKKDQIDRKVKSRANQRAEDEEKVKKDQKTRSKLCRLKRKAEDHNKLKEDQNAWQQKRRKIENEFDRLQDFKIATLHNAIFICTCCHQLMFKSNVRLYTPELANQVNSKKQGHTENCIQELISTIINGEKKYFICLTCVNHMKNKKIPPMSTKNGLELTETDKMIKDQNLDLTELEGALIAKNIIFQKIYQLPKSRWTALKDKIVNVPINEDSIINTLDQLPRTPEAAGLIGVALKRKVNYKNSHKQQLINPDKLFRMLHKLKSNQNPHYQFYDDYNTYQNRCKATDVSGYNVIFEDDVNEELTTVNGEQLDDLVDEIEMETKDENEDENIKEDEENELITKDPVRKFQFIYNESLCMTSKYPEISTSSEERNVEIAPGEGQIPKDIMSDENWDIKSFPHLHNPNGSNGKDQERKVRLTEQQYFIQRICNKEKRFSKSPAYMYAAVAYIEKKQIQRNINLAGTRGKKVNSEQGGQTYELDDGYRVLEDIKMTPKYWKKAKYEMIARLDNLGPFQLFFTLSCADMRWNENFAAILLERGYEIDYTQTHTLEDGSSETNIRARARGQEWKPIKQFMEENLEESLHELVRGNVLTATRYFEHRVKQFINKVMMGKNNPMHVKYYTYKVEFQDRGAGHIHGTLWLDLDKIENMMRNPGGTFRSKTDEEKRDKTVHGWMHRLKSAFKTLRHDGKLKNSEKESLRKFIDTYTTVSTHENTVGKDVAKIAQEVNKHHHTKTCRKHDTTCRFNYPRFPAPFTIIVTPCTAESPEERKKILLKNQKILTKVHAVLEDEEAVKKIMAKYDKQNETKEEYGNNRIERIKDLCKAAEVKYLDYLLALTMSKSGYSVVIKRDLDEIFINNYNIEWLRAWNGNMDIQVVLDFFAVITYVTDYYAKDDTGTMEIIKAALAQSESKDLKEKMKIIANTFLTHRQMGEAEACYRLLPSMLLRKSNVTCQWVNLGSKEDRSSRWRKASEEDLISGRPLIQLEGHEGYWYEQQDMWSKYLRRPLDILSDICFAQFAKMYRSYSQARANKEESADPEAKPSEDDGNDEDDGYESGADYDNDDKFNYIMTHDSKKRVKLPQYIELTNRYPGEPKMMIKRNHPAVLRYSKPNKDKNPKKFLLNELMLYRPLKDEIDIDQAESMYEETYEGKRKVDLVKAQVMEHLEGVEEARYYVEQVKKEIDLTEAAETLDPTLEQSNADCDEELEVEHPDFSHIDPGQIAAENGPAAAGNYKQIEIPNADELKRRTRILDKWQREVLNIGIRFAKDIVKGRRDGNAPAIPTLLMVHGGAGAGKSAVINVLAPWTQKILQQEGDGIESPCVIKAAFTGTAASNIEGQTLHGSFGFSFDNKHYSLSDKSRDQKRAAMKNLKLVIIDEISMVKGDMLYQLDLRLQEITEKVGAPFGGLSVIVLGDMMQLKPCMGRYICEEPLNPEFKITHHLAPRWEMFKPIILETNHRQGKDKQYAELLNRIRVGKQTEEDIATLRTRVRPKDHADLKSANLYIVCKRKACAEINESYLNSLGGELITIQAKHHHATQTKYKPYIEPKEGAVASTSFMDKLKVKIGGKIMIIHNIDTADGLTNGQMGELIHIVKTTKGEVDKLILKLANSKAGQKNRSQYPNLSSKFPNCVVIERVNLQYTLRKKGGEAGATANVIQFPLKLAFAITSHKIQGQTIPSPTKVVLDLNSIFEDAQAHVMLSRVQQLDQIYIMDSLDEGKIRTSPIGLRELHRLKENSINENPTPWLKPDKDSIKVASLNCAGLKPHFADIQADEHLLQADIIHLIETSLDDTEIEEYTLPGYNSHFINVGNGKGIATFYKPEVVKPEQDLKDKNIQITKFTSSNLDVINTYRSSNGHSVELLNTLIGMLPEKKAVVITGDFNICYQMNRTNRLIQGLETHGFKQLVHEATQIRGRHIDHAYWRDLDGIWTEPVVDRYSPYYSDHDGIGLTITKKNEEDKI